MGKVLRSVNMEYLQRKAICKTAFCNIQLPVFGSSDDSDMMKINSTCSPQHCKTAPQKNTDSQAGWKGGGKYPPLPREEAQQNVL